MLWFLRLRALHLGWPRHDRFEVNVERDPYPVVWAPGYGFHHFTFLQQRPDDWSCHKLGGKLKSAPKSNGSFPSLVRKHTSCIKLALISLRKPTECSKCAVSSFFVLHMI